MKFNGIFAGFAAAAFIALAVASTANSGPVTRTVYPAPTSATLDTGVLLASSTRPTFVDTSEREVRAH